MENDARIEKGIVREMEKRRKETEALRGPILLSNRIRDEGGTRRYQSPGACVNARPRVQRRLGKELPRGLQFFAIQSDRRFRRSVGICNRLVKRDRRAFECNVKRCARHSRKNSLLETRRKIFVSCDRWQRASAVTDDLTYGGARGSKCATILMIYVRVHRGDFRTYSCAEHCGRGIYGLATILYFGTVQRDSHLYKLKDSETNSVSRTSIRACTWRLLVTTIKLLSLIYWRSGMSVNIYL